jgi:hypothetical protein
VLVTKDAKEYAVVPKGVVKAQRQNSIGKEGYHNTLGAIPLPQGLGIQLLKAHPQLSVDDGVSVSQYT